MNKAERAYLAGFFDGEGCVSHKRGRPLISITQKDVDPLEWIQTVTGVGRIYPQRSYWQYVVTNRIDIRIFIQLIYPYSQVKRTQLREAYYYRYLKRWNRKM
jgi:intein/homing endonuclease